jgi:hypothetical protein
MYELKRDENNEKMQGKITTKMITNERRAKK